MGISKHVVAGIVLGFAFVAVSEALAEDPEKEAVVLFKTGKKLFHDEKYLDAANAFRQANEIKYSWKLLYNIGQADAAAKRYGLALEAFEGYLADGGDDVKNKRQKEVMAEIERLRGMVGYLTVQGDVGAVVVIDEVERGTVPLPGRIPVAAGSLHQMVVRLGEETLVDRSIKVGSGEALEVEASVAAPPAPETEVAVTDEVAPDAEPGKSKLRPIGWGILGVGAATAIVGIATGFGAMSKEGELSDACQDGVCTGDQRETYNSADKLAGVSSILLPVGAAVAATGLVLVIVSKKKESAEPDVVLVPSPIGVSLSGRF